MPLRVNSALGNLMYVLYNFQDLVILALSYATDRFPDLILEYYLLNRLID